MVLLGIQYNLGEMIFSMLISHSQSCLSCFLLLWEVDWSLVIGEAPSDRRECIALFQGLVFTKYWNAFKGWVKFPHSNIMWQILIISFKPPSFFWSQTSQMYKFLAQLVCHQILPDKQKLQLFLPFSIFFLIKVFWIYLVSCIWP